MRRVEVSSQQVFRPEALITKYRSSPILYLRRSTSLCNRRSTGLHPRRSTIYTLEEIPDCPSEGQQIVCLDKTLGEERISEEDITRGTELYHMFTPQERISREFF